MSRFSFILFVSCLVRNGICPFFVSFWTSRMHFIQKVSTQNISEISISIRMHFALFTFPLCVQCTLLHTLHTWHCTWHRAHCTLHMSHCSVYNYLWSFWSSGPHRPIIEVLFWLACCIPQLQTILNFSLH